MIANPTEEILLQVRKADKRQTIVTSITLKSDEQGFGELFLCAKQDAVTNAASSVSFRYQWQAPPVRYEGVCRWSKFWDFSRGDIFTSSYSKESFASQRILWKPREHHISECIVESIEWTPRRRYPVVYPPSVKKVGEIVLRLKN